MSQLLEVKDVAFEKVDQTRSYIRDIDEEVRAKLVREYNEKLKVIDPDLRELGRATGRQMLVSSLPSRSCSSVSRV